MNDNEFKEKFDISDFKKEKFNSKFYNPDLYFKNNDEAIWIEHSKTGDRKVHIGELCQFINVVSELNKNMILILDGVGETAPTPILERDRLRFYMKGFNTSLMENINFIGVVKNKEDINNLTFDDLKKKCEIIYKKS
ncbi:MAG: hypothetical protein E6936_06170 [Clostridium perfringens]|uniref:hypothetical protein n=1 Tax=Clostridium perfringens TaxID=1502 RepID=UPI000F535962|nr:hypothetical protein [Clostridium perfringens]MDK3223290.1 hypothetical protein [Clostridium perfringens]MDM0807204.1 hypothetical protein [Clostridium perfringens]MDU1307034.1 hypothetical protein [Clostridium perfringens]QPS31282.1 hypothetical protein I6G60_03650 [Clostridium perfringens]RQN16895.1 hypothetical protein EHZ12_09975 [Clostridium perfringens]